MIPGIAAISSLESMPSLVEGEPVPASSSGDREVHAGQASPDPLLTFRASECDAAIAIGLGIEAFLELITEAGVWASQW
jgi:hypothetical protein